MYAALSTSIIFLSSQIQKKNMYIIFVKCSHNFRSSDYLSRLSNVNGTPHALGTSDLWSPPTVLRWNMIRWHLLMISLNLSQYKRY